MVVVVKIILGIVFVIAYLLLFYLNYSRFKKLKKDKCTIAKWETGAALPRADKLPELASVLNCEISDLYNNVDQ